MASSIMVRSPRWVKGFSAKRMSSCSAMKTFLLLMGKDALTLFLIVFANTAACERFSPLLEGPGPEALGCGDVEDVTPGTPGRTDSRLSMRLRRTF